MVMLVLLRINIGWHFFSEGKDHVLDPNWTSEPVLRAATGPLAPMFRSYLPDYFGLSALKSTGDMDAADAWVTRIGEQFSQTKSDFERHYQLSAEQVTEANRLLEARTRQLTTWWDEQKEDVETYLHERQRLATARSQPTAREVPFQKSRIAQKQAELNAQGRGWLADLQGMELGLKNDLQQLLTTEQSAKGAPPRKTTKLQQIDKVMSWGILAIGACLIIGLFTRLACVLGAAFLVSVVLTQPFWFTESAPTFNQWVEMLALLTLATTHVGKWGGVDFFISALLGGCCRCNKNA
jgi:uncharacterized membrane protein YphA (DoxX/SURF4 family)